MVGLGSHELKVPRVPIIMRCVRLIGSLGSSMEDVKEVFQLLSSSKITPELQEIPFEDIPEGLERLGRGEVVGRLFARPGSSK